MALALNPKPSMVPPTAAEVMANDLNHDGVFDRTDVLLEEEWRRKARRLRVGDREVSEEQLKTILHAFVIPVRSGARCLPGVVGKPL